MNRSIDELRALAIAALGRMFRPEVGRYAFRLRRLDGCDALEGDSLRYTAITLIGLANETEAAAAVALEGQRREDVARQLVRQVEFITDLGDAALVLWAARAIGIDGGPALSRLIALNPVDSRHRTVELAWALSAMAGDAGHAFGHCSLTPAQQSLCDEWSPRWTDLLLRRFDRHLGVFAHGPRTGLLGRLNSHVACFADLVYPIVALAQVAVATGCETARNAVRRCADFMRDSQGPDGQWWWHFDVRTGHVVERYPVYAVHQDGMAPMALLAAGRACGVDYSEAVMRGMHWLKHAPEIDGSLIDEKASVIWRKVARREPGKWSRTAQALSTRLHSSLRMPGLDALCPPGRIDFETRPYHMGWLLYAWGPTFARSGENGSWGENRHGLSKVVADAATV